MYQLGAELIGWTRRHPTGAQTSTLRRGFGVGSTSWPKIPAQAEAEVVVNRDGSVEARTGTQDIGTRTAHGHGRDRGREARRPAAFRAGQDRKLLVAGRSSLRRIGHRAEHRTGDDGGRRGRARKVLEIVARQRGVDASELDIVDGYVLQRTQPLMDWEEACRGLPADGVTGRGSTRTSGDYRGEGHSNGVQFVELEVDAETGVVRVERVVAIQACGQIVVRKTAESQIIGGVIQGISYALFEDKILDRNVGAMVNPNLEMYKILGTVDMPKIEPILWTKGQTGVRSLGEPPTIPTSGAMACAVYNAIGAPVRSLPMTPDKVLAALEGGAA